MQIRNFASNTTKAGAYAERGAVVSVIGSADKKFKQAEMTLMNASAPNPRKGNVVNSGRHW
jgi:hypothetical protein